MAGVGTLTWPAWGIWIEEKLKEVKKERTRRNSSTLPCLGVPHLPQPDPRIPGVRQH